MIDESERISALLSAAKEDVVKVSELLERTDKEKRRLQEKNAKLTITGAFVISRRFLRMGNNKVPFVTLMYTFVSCKEPSSRPCS